MRTPYVHHCFGEAAHTKVKSTLGWLTAGVASSIPWPQEDVWLLYDGHEYLLQGAKGGGDRPVPCISTPCAGSETDEGMARIYLFSSVLGWFKGGYVDVTGHIWGSRPVSYASRDTFAAMHDGSKYFNCNYMPIIEDDQVRKALAFMREGRRLRYIHEPYSFLSFFKVLESQFKSKDNGRVEWIQTNLDQLDGEAGKRVAELRAQGVDVSKHLYQSGRCAVAHASLDGPIVDPDIPADRRRIAEDLEVMAGLASRYIKVGLGVPDDMELYRNRDRTAPWHALFAPETLETLKAASTVSDSAAFDQLQNARVAVRLWPHDAPECMQNMSLFVEGCAAGVLVLLLVNERRTIFLRFILDVAQGRLHTILENGGFTDRFEKLMQEEIEHYTRYFHSVIANVMVELCIDGYDPVPCEIVIPHNIIPQAPDKMVALALEEFRKRNAALVDDLEQRKPAD